MVPPRLYSAYINLLARFKKRKPAMPDTTLFRLADLGTGAPTPFDLRPDAERMRALADTLGLDGLRKLRLAGKLTPEGRRDWRLEATLGATVVQPCVITLAPVTTRIDAPVTRTYTAAFAAPEAGETEMPEDDSAEPLPEAIDLMALLEEALALNLPLYPKAEGAELETANFAEPGITPMQDEDARPFAGLAGLRAQLDEKE